MREELAAGRVERAVSTLLERRASNDELAPAAGELHESLRAPTNSRRSAGCISS
jgi:hypothetical protein